MDYALGLRALIAESDYDAGFTLRGQELQQDSETLLLFDAGNHPRIQLDPKLPADARTHDSRPGEKRPTTEAQSSDNERLIGKVRGRPRANHKDVTAADVSVLNFWFLPLSCSNGMKAILKLCNIP
jgi:hypothetical protein